MTDRELLMQFAGYLSATLPEYTSRHPEEIGRHVEPFLQAARAAPAQPETFDFDAWREKTMQLFDEAVACRSRGLVVASFEAYDALKAHLEKLR
jgi:hypothetical protein